MPPKVGGTALGARHEPAIEFASVRSLLDRYAARDAGKTALYDLDQGTSIAFGALRDAVDRVGRWLAGRGIGKGDRVALLSGECLEKLILWLGVWRIGAVVCPLNVEINAAYLAELLRSVEPKLTLWQDELAGDAAGEAVRFGRWRPDAAGSAGAWDVFDRPDDPGTGRPVETENEASDLACIFCTSGTTDKPKLLFCDHMGYWLFGLSSIENVGHTERDRTLEYRSFGWSSAQGMSLLPWLQTGCTLHVASRFSRGRFFDWVKTHGITFTPGIPTVINMLLNRPVGVSADDVPTLRVMSCSTAPLSPERWQRFEDMYGIPLLQMYGSSEAGWVCGNRRYYKKKGTVGPPAKHQEFRIVDAAGDPCPPGVEGEVTVGGPQCCIGAISPDGVWEDFRGKRIHMVDLAVMDEDGFVTVTGRLKDLIIRGGVNVAPLEIDNVLLGNAKIAEAAAVGVPDEIYGEEIVCYVVSKPGEVLTEDEVRRHCAAKLPAYKTPKEIHLVEDLPRNDRGKVRRDALKARWRADSAAG